MKKLILLKALVFSCFFCFSAYAQKYESNWQSLRRVQVPKWLQEGKFGIYTHWGVYAVHAHGSNTTWYSNELYRNPHSEARKHFEGKFGSLDSIGYKDLILKFTAENFDAEEWAELFAKSGAKFAGPVAEHHDGFAMWDTQYSNWNAAKMGPKRDVVGELEKAIKAKDMKFVTAFHHAANWFWYPVSDARYDTSNPKYADLYGQYHKPGDQINEAFLDEWYHKIIEVIDNYGPDFIWFDFALDDIAEGYVKDFMTYYYNDALNKNKEVVITYKGHDLIPGSGVRDLELGQEDQLTYNEWITDNSVDDRGAWGWAENLTFKTPNRLIDNLVDRVSKNGYLLLNVGPKPDGTIPEGAKEVLLAMGTWLETNGEAIYGTSPWFIASVGPTNLEEVGEIGFNESDQIYTPEDIRFTVKGDNLYATFLDWPGDYAIIPVLRGDDPDVATGIEKYNTINPNDYKDVATIAGHDFKVKVEDLGTVKLSFKENQKVIATGGDFETKVNSGYYTQNGAEIFLETEEFEGYFVYDGETLHFTPEDLDTPVYRGFYKSEIKSISLLGDDKPLDWSLTRHGLVIKTPQKKGNYAYVFKIERHHKPVFKKH
ncbi:alpha-L-fucosidase [Seonamhaeicola sp.]|uniref:alpha-L-fucosidase n=1 Tax=Seonamhaeicola sp. TaxID=1912245 RepID=UPI002608A5BA|nr:alpha-L-fucosidase [Seonamhaeicola sp.]